MTADQPAPLSREDRDALEPFLPKPGLGWPVAVLALLQSGRHSDHAGAGCPVARDVALLANLARQDADRDRDGLRHWLVTAIVGVLPPVDEAGNLAADVAEGIVDAALAGQEDSEGLPADPEPIANETKSGYERRQELVAEARDAALRDASERVAAIRPRPNLQGSPVNAYLSAVDAALAASAGAGEPRAPEHAALRSECASCGHPDSDHEGFDCAYGWSGEPNEEPCECVGGFRPAPPATGSPGLPEMTLTECLDAARGHIKPAIGRAKSVRPQDSELIELLTAAIEEIDGALYLATPPHPDAP